MKFEVGETVAVYWGQRTVQTIESIMANGTLAFAGPKGPNWVRFAHPKQCRKLRPRRRVWVSKYFYDSKPGHDPVVNWPNGAPVLTTAYSAKPDGDEWIEFIEIKKT